MSVLELFAVLLTAACIALTAGFLGTLRGVAEIRIRISGQGAKEGQWQLYAGTGLPNELLRTIETPDALGLLLFLSDNCSACWQLVDALPKMQLGDATVTVCLDGHSNRAIATKLGDRGHVVDRHIAARAAEYFKIESTPVAVVHRGGFIVGSAYGSSAESTATIQRLWSASAGPDEFRPSDPEPLELVGALSALDHQNSK